MLLKHLHEPNETHLGLSKKESKGKAVGNIFAEKMARAIKKSKAIQTGLIEDVEDSLLFINGIGDDIVSDITTNLIRRHLIEYTQQQCQYLGIPLTSNIDSGPLWLPLQKKWINQHVSLPIINHQKIILVPKAIVRRKMDYQIQEYYRHYLLVHLQNTALAANSALVEVLKNGTRRVTKKSLIKKFGNSKEAIIDLTLENMTALNKYRKHKADNIQQPLSDIEISEITETEEPDWDKLLSNVISTPTGKKHANTYHKNIAALFNALFYPDLINPIIEQPIHGGKKRIDIAYTNIASYGFFYWVSNHYPAANIVVECKNYKAEPKNPEVDQLIGRFSPSRGQVGILVHRTSGQDLEDRCQNAANDRQGYIINLQDTDLKTLVELRKKNNNNDIFKFLKKKFDRLTNTY